VTIDGVWIGNRIYCTRTLNYNLLQLSLSGLFQQQLSLSQLSHTDWLSQLSLLWTLTTTNSAESLARAQDLLQTHFTVSELSTQTALPVASLPGPRTSFLRLTLNSSLKTEDLTNSLVRVTLRPTVSWSVHHGVEPHPDINYSLTFIVLSV
jgi:hypothetical protein